MMGEKFTVSYAENYRSGRETEKSYTLFFEGRDKEVEGLTLEDLEELRDVIDQVLKAKAHSKC